MNIAKNTIFSLRKQNTKGKQKEKNDKMINNRSKKYDTEKQLLHIKKALNYYL